MKYLFLKVFVILMSILMATAAYAQHQGLSFNYFGGGARSEGMGQAYIAISDGGSAGSWNPAGLYIHEKVLMTFGYSFLNPRGEYTFYTTRCPVNGSLYRSNNYDHSGSFGTLNNWSIITPLRIKGHHFIFNVSYTQNFNTYNKFGEKQIEFMDIDFEDSTDNNDPNSFFERKGGVNSINLGFGTRVYKQLAFGVSGNIYCGKVVTDENALWRQKIDVVVGNDKIMEMERRVIDSTAYTGFNLTLGLLYTTEKLRAGLMVRQPFILKGESDTMITAIPTLNGIPSTEVDGLWAIKEHDSLYYNNTTSKMHMPLMIGLGTGYYIKDNWLISADIEYRGFSGKDVENRDSVKTTASGENEEIYSTTDSIPNWSNVIQFRFGTEYMLKTSIGDIPLRFGFRNEAFPEGNISSYWIEYDGPKNKSNDSSRVLYHFKYDDEKVTGFSFSLGTGIHWEQILLDFAYTYTTYEQMIYLAQNVYYDEPNLRSKNEFKNHHINITFTGYF